MTGALAGSHLFYDPDSQTSHLQGAVPTGMAAEGGSLLNKDSNSQNLVHVSSVNDPLVAPSEVPSGPNVGGDLHAGQSL